VTGAGRPLRFLVIVIGAWIVARIVLLWPHDAIAVAEQAMLPRSVAAAPTAEIVPRHLAMQRSIGAGRSLSLEHAASPPAPATSAPQSTAVLAAGAMRVVPPVVQHSIEPPSPRIAAGLPVLRPTAPAPRRSRLFGSAWALVRGGSGPADGIPGVQLGGAQAGLRLAYALTADRRLALAVRASSPLGEGMREVALGVEWQPTRLPVRLVAEHRFALGAGRGGPTLAVVGGIGPMPLAAGFALESYAQAGIIGRDGGEGYADGAVRIARPVARLGGTRFDLGGGAWGAAQKGARRLDLGPSLSATVPLGRQPVRLSLDWRQRVAGNASPGSGPVVTLGADF
jgi:hypothetical protein